MSRKIRHTPIAGFFFILTFIWILTYFVSADGVNTDSGLQINQLDPYLVFPMHYKTEKSRTKAPVYTEKDILSGFPGAKRIRQSSIAVSKEWLAQKRQVNIPDYLYQNKKRTK